MHVDTCPVGEHNMHGRVERKIKAVRSSLKKNMHQHRLSIIQWETVSSFISNSINMPLAIKNVKAEVEMADLITPNGLLLGRNNERSSTGILSLPVLFISPEVTTGSFQASKLLLFSHQSSSHSPEFIKLEAMIIDKMNNDAIILNVFFSGTCAVQCHGMLEIINASFRNSLLTHALYPLSYFFLPYNKYNFIHIECFFTQ